MLITTDNDTVHLAGAMGKKDSSYHRRKNTTGVGLMRKNGKTSEWYGSVTFYLKPKGETLADVIKLIKF